MLLLHNIFPAAYVPRVLTGDSSIAERSSLSLTHTHTLSLTHTHTHSLSLMLSVPLSLSVYVSTPPHEPVESGVVEY